MCSQYGYAVEYGGVGEPPADRAEVGYCSQMATFTLSTGTVSEVDSHPSTYKVVCCICDVNLLSVVVIIADR